MKSKCKSCGVFTGKNEHLCKLPWNKNKKGIQAYMNTSGLLLGRGWNKGIRTIAIKQYFCIDCGVEKKSDTKLCRSCSSKIMIRPKMTEKTKRKISESNMEDAQLRFWSKVEKTKTCWIWKAHKSKQGYGSFSFKNKYIRASRMVWFLTYGKWPNNYICHACDNPPCVNPGHLFDGTAKDNIQDAFRKGRWKPPKLMRKTNGQFDKRKSFDVM